MDSMAARKTMGRMGTTAPRRFTLPFEFAGDPLISPTLSAELVSDPTLEGVYTAGLAAGLTKGGSPTVAESADAHGGSKAQSFTPVANANYVSHLINPATTGRIYIATAWGKRTAGTNSKVVLGTGTNGFPVAFNQSSYVQRRWVYRAPNTGAIAFGAYQNGTGYDTIIMDDLSVKYITDLAEMFRLWDTGVVDMIAKIKATYGRDGFYGVAAKIDSKTNPQNGLVAYYRNYDNTYCYCILDKIVGGVWTNLISTWSNVPGSGGGQQPTNSQWLEIRVSGTTVQLYQNNLQVGGNQTVNDAGIVNNTLAGVFGDGGTSLLASFFVQEN